MPDILLMILFIFLFVVGFSLLLASAKEILEGEYIYLKVSLSMIFLGILLVAWFAVVCIEYPEVEYLEPGEKYEIEIAHNSAFIKQNDRVVNINDAYNINAKAGDYLILSKPVRRYGGIYFSHLFTKVEIVTAEDTKNETN